MPWLQNEAVDLGISSHNCVLEYIEDRMVERLIMLQDGF